MRIVDDRLKQWVASSCVACGTLVETASSTPLSTKIYRTGGFCDWR